MRIFGKLLPKEKSPKITRQQQKDAHLVAEYSRGSVYLQFGRYYTESDKEARRAKLAAMDL